MLLRDQYRRDPSAETEITAATSVSRERLDCFPEGGLYPSLAVPSQALQTIPRHIFLLERALPEQKQSSILPSRWRTRQADLSDRSSRTAFLHPFRERDAEDRHCLAEDSCYGFHQNQTVLEEGLVFFAEDRSVVIVLVELLGELVCVVCYHGR